MKCDTPPTKSIYPIKSTTQQSQSKQLSQPGQQTQSNQWNQPCPQSVETKNQPRQKKKKSIETNEIEQADKTKPIISITPTDTIKPMKSTRQEV
jgi:hypothetical protein